MDVSRVGADNPKSSSFSPPQVESGGTYPPEDAFEETKEKHLTAMFNTIYLDYVEDLAKEHSHASSLRSVAIAGGEAI